MVLQTSYRHILFIVLIDAYQLKNQAIKISLRCHEIHVINATFCSLKVIFRSNTSPVLYQLFIGGFVLMRTRSILIAALFLALVVTIFLVSFSLSIGLVHSQNSVTQTPLPGEGTAGIMVIPAGDSQAFLRALLGPSTNDLMPRVIYLAGGVYRFSNPGTYDQPQMPPWQRSKLVVYGNRATFEFIAQPPVRNMPYITVESWAEVEFHHITLEAKAGSGRMIVNRGRLTLYDSTVINNQDAPSYLPGDGGGIVNEGILTVIRSTLTRNKVMSSNEPGGAILNKGWLTVTCSRFDGNRAGQGGAIFNANETEAKATIAHNAFTGNQANGGGAIFNAKNSQVEAAENWWNGADPVVNNTLLGLDTVSDFVHVLPWLDTDPTQTLAECRSPEPDPLPQSDQPTSTASVTANPRAVAPLAVTQPNLPPSPIAYFQDSATVGLVDTNGGLTTLTGLRGATDTPVWSPDGRKIAYVSNRAGNYEIYVRDLQTGTEVNVTNSTASDRSPAWSPDSSQIAFDSDRYGRGNIYLVGADGSNLRVLYGSTATDTRPSWSPDGSKIVGTLGIAVDNTICGSMIAEILSP